MSVKKLHFEAAAQYRISQEDLEKGRRVDTPHGTYSTYQLTRSSMDRYGEEIARLQIAEGLTKKAISEARNGVADTVLSDLKVIDMTFQLSSRMLILRAGPPEPRKRSCVVPAASYPRQ
jgi:programmed cell death 6-interacting protein